MVSLLLEAVATGSVLLWSFLFFVNPFNRNQTANFWVGVFLLCYGLALLSKLLYLAFQSLESGAIVVLIDSTRFVMAPALYFAICFFVRINYRISYRRFLHFLPAIFFLIVVFLNNIL